MPTGTPPTGGLQRQSTNPFAQRASQQPQPMQPQPTGTNPFSRNITPISEDHQTTSPPQQQQPSSQPPSLSPLQMQPTGSTNPFRQSTFVNQQTGMGWQNAGPQATIGGWGDIGTVEVFPRPGGGGGGGMGGMGMNGMSMGGQQGQPGQQQAQGQWQQSPWG
ncbi:hypothetical protein KC318_g22309 [Hortaea werneckii]|nr:hypothetical protein KC318_g22309 [Hortaea werneckii]